MQEPLNEGPDDWYFDEQSQSWLRHSGRAHWRQVLADRRTWAATPEAQAVRQAFLDRYGMTLHGSTAVSGAKLGRMEFETSTAEPARPQTAAQRFMALIGQPMPAPMTAEQRADYEARMEAADADLLERIERRNHGQSAA